MCTAAEMMMVIGRAGIAVVVMLVRSVVMIRLAAGLGGMMADVGADDIRSQEPGTQPGQHAENHQSCEKMPHQQSGESVRCAGNSRKNPGAPKRSGYFQKELIQPQRNAESTKNLFFFAILAFFCGLNPT